MLFPQPSHVDVYEGATISAYPLTAHDWIMTCQGTKNGQTRQWVFHYFPDGRIEEVPYSPHIFGRGTLMPTHLGLFLVAWDDKDRPWHAIDLGISLPQGSSLPSGDVAGILHSLDKIAQSVRDRDVRVHQRIDALNADIAGMIGGFPALIADGARIEIKRWWNSLIGTWNGVTWVGYTDPRLHNYTFSRFVQLLRRIHVPVPESWVRQIPDVYHDEGDLL